MSVSPFVRDRFTWLAYGMLAYYAYLQAVLGPLMPFLRDELDLSYTVTGLHPSAFALGMILAGLTGDRLARRWGRPTVFWGGSLGMAAGAAGLALSNRVSLTITSVLVMGWLGTLLLVMIQATLSDRHGDRRTIALTESNVVASIFASLAPVFVGGFQRAGLGWRGALFLAVGVIGLLFARFYRQPMPEAPPEPTDSSRSNEASVPLAFWAYWSVVILVVSIEWCLIFWGADFLESVVGFSKVNAATTMSVFFGAMVLGRIIGSRLARTVPGASLLLLALGTALVGFPLFWLARLATLNVVGLFIAGLGVANLFPLTLSVAVGTAPRRANIASARVALGGGLAILISPFVLGWLADQLSLQQAFGIVALLQVAAIIVTFLTSRLATSRRPTRNSSIKIDDIH